MARESIKERTQTMKGLDSQSILSVSLPNIMIACERAVLNTSEDVTMDNYPDIVTQVEGKLSELQGLV